MQIVELGDYSMVIMKDSQDPPWSSVGNIYRHAVKWDSPILVDVGDTLSFNHLISSEHICTAGRLILFFKDKIPDRFHKNDKVIIV